MKKYASSEYSEKLKNPRWQKKRLEILNRDKFTCLDCAEKNKTLHVHHIYYVKGREPWEYPDWSLRTVCFECHKENYPEPEIPGEERNVIYSWETALDFFLDGQPIQESYGPIWNIGVDMHIAQDSDFLSKIEKISSTLARKSRK